MISNRISRWPIYSTLVLAIILTAALIAAIHAVPALADASAGNARELNGKGTTATFDYINAGNDPSLNAASIRTMEAWVKFHDLDFAGGSTQEILSKATLSPAAGIELVKSGPVATGELIAVVAGSSGGVPARAMASLPITNNLQNERWYHIAVAHNGPRTALYLYVDGVLRVTAPDLVPDVISDSLNSLTIGNNWESGYPFIGQIDEVRIWNTQRTGGQIRANMYKELTGSETGLVAYYPLNQTSGTAVPDRSTTVKSLNLTSGGSGYTSLPAVTLSGGGGSGATAQVATMRINGAAIVNAGSGYTLNDVLTINGGTSTSQVTLTVTSVGGSGNITGVSIGNSGAYSALPSNPVSVSGGSGSGATFNLNWAVNALSVTAGGSGYTSAPTVSFSGGGGGSGAAANANVSNSGNLDWFHTPADPNWPDNGWVTSGAFYGQRNALDFDGSNDFVVAPSAITSVTNVSNLTLIAWVKRDVSAAQEIVCLNNSGTSTQVVDFHLNASNQLEYTRNGVTAVASTGTINQGEWTHVAMVQTGTNVQLYINGVPDGAGTVSASTTGINSTYLGMRQYNATVSQRFNGQIAEVQLWTTALTSAQIRDYMNKSLGGDETGLIAYYRTDYGIPGGDNSGLATLYDITANANHGTLTNFALTGSTSNWVSSNIFNVWIGSEGTNWALPGNWSRGAVPTTTDNLSIINYTGGNSPIITDTAYFKHLVVASGATLEVAGSHTLNAGGNWINNGTFNAGSSTLSFSGNETHNLVLPAPTTFDNLIVNTGAVLVETEAADNASITSILTNHGTIRKTQSATTTGNRTFGLTGVAINVDTVGNLSTLTVNRVDANHPNAGVAAMQTGRYWGIRRVLAGGSTEGQIDVTLPYPTAVALSKACRWVNGIGAGFDCGQNSDNTVVPSVSVRRNNYATASWTSPFDTWTAGNSNSPQTITVQANPSTMFGRSGATSAVTATVVDSLGNQVTGVGLTGVTLPSSLGAVSALGTTNSSGQAFGTWTAGLVPGTGSLNAGNGSITGTTSITLTVGAPYTVTLAANPTSLTVGNSSDLTATVTDFYGNLLSGVTVTFTTDLGNVVSPRTTVNGVATSTITSTVSGTAHVAATTNSRTGTATVVFVPGAAHTLVLAANPTSLTVDSTSAMTATVTDQYGNFVANGASVSFSTNLGNVLSPRSTTNGVATSTLSSTVPGTAHVIATSGAATQSADVVFAPGAPFTVTVQASPDSLTANGTSTSTITATVTDRYSNLVIDGTSVSFSTAPLGTVLTPRTTTNGRAVTTFTASTMAGTATVTATTNGRNGTAQVTLMPGAPYTLTLLVNPTSLVVGNTSALTATVTDQFGNLVINGTNVVFATSLGSVLSPRVTTNGVATSTLGSTVAGTAHITATSGAAGQSATVVYAPDVPFTVTVQAQPTIIVANGSTSTITATVTDRFSNPVADGTSVAFTTTGLGTVSSPHTTTNGRAVATFTSGTVDGATTVTAIAGSASGGVNLALTAGVVDLATSVKAASAKVVAPGMVLTYTITLTNTGNTLGTNVSLTDTIPLHTSYVTNSVTGVGATYNSGSNQIEWSGAVPLGGSVTFSYAVEVSYTAPLQLVNDAYVSILGVYDRTLTATTTVRRFIYLPLIARNP